MPAPAESVVVAAGVVPGVVAGVRTRLPPLLDHRRHPLVVGICCCHHRHHRHRYFVDHLERSPHYLFADADAADADLEGQLSEVGGGLQRGGNETKRTLRRSRHGEECVGEGGE